MSKVYELSDGTIQEVFENGLIISHKSFDEITIDLFLESEYFQIENIYPRVLLNYFEGKDLIEFQNGRKELVKDYKKTIYADKCIKLVYRNNAYESRALIELVKFKDGSEKWMSGIEVDTISKFKILTRETMF